MQQNYWIVLLMYATLLCNSLQASNSTSLLAPSSAVHENLVDIGRGRKMFLECLGEGLPTVIFISGRSDRGTTWNTATDASKETVFAAVAKFTHACTYDRPGTVTITKQNDVLPSRSSPIQQPTNSKNGVEDLHALLKAAKIPGPYVLVAHSYGGLIARLYAKTYPEEVSGLVLIDTLTEFLYDALTPTQQTMWMRLNNIYSPDLDRYIIQEKTDLLSSFSELRSFQVLRPIPVVILTSDQSYDFKKLINQGILPADTPLNFETVVFQAHLQGQKRLAKLLHAKEVNNTHSGHYIHVEQPQLVIDEIRNVVEQSKNR